MPEPQTIDVRTQQVTLKTKRGLIKIGPRGKIDGLHQIIRKELRTNTQVRKMCGGIQRSTLIRWRNSQTHPFPAPWLKIPARPAIELWSRTEVEQWLAEREQRKIEREEER